MHHIVESRQSHGVSMCRIEQRAKLLAGRAEEDHTVARMINSCCFLLTAYASNCENEAAPSFLNSHGFGDCFL